MTLSQHSWLGVFEQGCVTTDRFLAQYFASAQLFKEPDLSFKNSYFTCKTARTEASLEMQDMKVSLHTASLDLYSACSASDGVFQV